MTTHSYVDPDDNDANLVEHWLKADVTRWIVGAISGVLAAWIAFGFASVFAKAFGYEIFFAIKLMATPFLGEVATEYGVHLGALVVGGAFLSILGGFLGAVFAHFTFTNHVPSLLAMGAVWGTFSWIFIWNLFFRSIRPMLFMNVPSSAAFPVCMIFGISLVTVGALDRMLRRK